MLKEYGIEMIRLNLPFRLNHVNCFLAEGEHGFKVLDAGLKNRETAERWDTELAGKEVTDLIVTHYHPDHFGYAGTFQEKYNVRVSMSEIDTKNGMSSWEPELLSHLEEYYTLSGVAVDTGRKMFENTADFVPHVTPYPKVEHYLQEGERIAFGKYEYEVIFTPGHSEGLVTFYNKEKNTLISTDHILPKITPNISHWYHGDPNPLGSYYQSLDKIAALEVDYIIPSHGDPFHNGHERVLELKAHHDERLETLLDILRHGHTVFEATEKLFNKILTIHETRFAVGEALAHLEYLRINGDCTRELENGVYVYKRV